MFDVSLIARALSGPGQSALGPTVAAIDGIVQLAQTGEAHEAAERAADLLADGCTDVRVIVAYTLGAFEERGPEGLPAILNALADALAQSWAKIRPEARRDRAVDSALSLALRTIKAMIDFHEATRDASWQAWAERMTPELSAACTAAASALREAVSARIDPARCLGELSGLGDRANRYFQRLPPKAPVATPGAEPEPAVEPPPSLAPEPPSRAPDDGASHGPPIDVSPALATFLRKLGVFETLVQRGDMGKAAIVAQDIRAVVDRFDPRVYFPKLLAPHYRLLSAHAADLASHWEAAGTPAGDALAQLYQVDLDAFVEP